MQAEASIRRAAIRPWATSNRYVYEAYGGAVYYEYDQRMLEYVKTWGYLDVWNYREYQTYLNHFQPAVIALAAYYRTAFDVPEKVVVQRAQKIFEEITGAHFLLPYRYESGSLEYHFDYNDLQYAGLQIRMLEGESLSSLLANITGKEKLPVANAVEHPSLLNALIELGVDVNTPNGWDKTPLMVAAHLNRPDSVKLLLQAGADLNATTKPMNECGVTIERGDRTALMYAAENADIDVIWLLVDAGAKVDVKDSLGDGLGYYLSRNPYLTTAQRGMTVPELLASTREAQTTAPSFDCMRAKQWVEKMICNDSALARQDRELAGAFTTWMRKSSSPDRTRVEQVAWLKRRTEQCQSVKEETRAMSCLQQQTRARIRYFHNRIAE
jgi:uncharacterized protein YecT (DUF1311 family)